ncbi:MAG: MBL fold metallo-hydrolase [Gemmatimonadales bacterium]|nr:MBL fold metallo-hydrolase [Gemmatimonadales bacterium]
MLGTGTPNPDPERSGPAVLVVVNNTPYLFDAGAGVVRRAEQANRAGVAGTAPGRIGAAFLTHLHSDHTVGLPDLIHTGRIAGRKAPLQLFGPPGTSAMAGHLAKAFREDIRIREEGLEPDKGNWWKTVARNVTGGEVYRDSNVVVTAIPVPHANWKTALAYRVVGSDGRVIVISGDTGPSDGIVKACDGCDVLVHEVYSAERLKARPADWQAYHRGAHTSTVELAALAGRARPKLLVLYHQLYWGGTDEELLAEIRAAGYTGAVLSARDLAVYE